MLDDKKHKFFYVNRSITGKNWRRNYIKFKTILICLTQEKESYYGNIDSTWCFWHILMVST